VAVSLVVGVASSAAALHLRQLLPAPPLSRASTARPRSPRAAFEFVFAARGAALDMPASSKGRTRVGEEDIAWLLYDSGVLKVRPPTAERFMVRMRPGDDPAARAAAEYRVRLGRAASLPSTSAPPPPPPAAAAAPATTAAIRAGPAAPPASSPLAPESKARSSGYYYAAVPKGECVLPVAAPVPISGRGHAGSAAAGAIQRDLEVRGAENSYYYAHARAKDYHVPTVPQRIAPDGSLTPWEKEP